MSDHVTSNLMNALSDSLDHPFVWQTFFGPDDFAIPLSAINAKEAVFLNASLDNKKCVCPKAETLLIFNSHSADIAYMINNENFPHLQKIYIFQTEMESIFFLEKQKIVLRRYSLTEVLDHITFANQGPETESQAREYVKRQWGLVQRMTDAERAKKSQLDREILNSQPTQQLKNRQIENQPEPEPIYSGEWSEDKANGSGQILYNNGTVFKGSLKNRLKTGHCTTIFPSNCFQNLHYESEVVNKQLSKNNSIYSEGEILFANGEQYVGKLKNEQFDGFGTMYYNNGSKYSGMWRENERNGTGTFVDEFGNEYVGEWEEGRERGRVKVVYLSGAAEEREVE